MVGELCNCGIQKDDGSGGEVQSGYGSVRELKASSDWKKSSE